MQKQWVDPAIKHLYWYWIPADTQSTQIRYCSNGVQCKIPLTKEYRQPAMAIINSDCSFINPSEG